LGAPAQLAAGGGAWEQCLRLPCVAQQQPLLSGRVLVSDYGLCMPWSEFSGWISTAAACRAAGWQQPTTTPASACVPARLPVPRRLHYLPLPSALLALVAPTFKRHQQTCMCALDCLVDLFRSPHTIWRLLPVQGFRCPRVYSLFCAAVPFPRQPSSEEGLLINFRSTQVLRTRVGAQMGAVKLA